VPRSFVIKGGTGKAVRLAAGSRIAIVNLHGQQVVDTWALCAGDTSEAMSMEHTRSCLDKLCPRAGDSLYSNRRRPIIRFEEDTSPGVHDTLLSACDEERYRLLGCKDRHASCAENFGQALGELGIAAPRIPSPWNLFENVAIDSDGKLSIRPPVARPGDHVVLTAIIDLIVVLSACPMDIALTNGLDRRPKDVGIEVE
jgi:uncharacterized protein YcgI (DUF1989 family)